MTASPELPPITSKDSEPARLLWTELETRIATQPLHYRSGDEETAAKSLHELFPKTRGLMAEHWEALAFATAAIHLLNEVLRSNTARWHRWIVDKKFADERSRRQFRYELQLLQPRLAAFSKLLVFIAEQKTPEAQEAFATLLAKRGSDRYADLGRKVCAGIAEEVPLKSGSVHPRVSSDNFATAEEIDWAEHAAIVERRNILAREDALAGKSAADQSRLEKAPLENATGICLSGGGIRSATFCLGIVQVLARRGLFSRFDYLSTVSGGGYLGAFLTSFLGTPPAHPGGIGATIEAAFVGQGGRESAAIRHLRHNSRYLLRSGLLKRSGLIISGIVTNILLMLPIPLMAVLGVWALVLLGYWGPEASFDHLGPLGQSPAFQVFARLGIVLATVWLALPVIRNLARGALHNSARTKLRNFFETACIVLGVVTLASCVLLLVPLVFDYLARVRTTEIQTGQSSEGNPLRFVLSLIQYARGNADSDDAVQAITAFSRSERIWGNAAAVAPIILGLLAAFSKAGTKTKQWSTLLFVLSGPLLALAVFLVVGNRTVGPHAIWPVAWVAGITTALVAWAWLFVDINEFSPHRYYRNRLCECYLAVRQSSQRGGVRSWLRRLLQGRKKGETFSTSGVGSLRQLPLSQMNATKAAPYHLINTAVNLPASLDPHLRGRDCDFFTFSRDFCGGPVCGYIKTTTVEKLDPHVDLGTAVAVSGAAASSNMGVSTMRHLRFLLSLLNVRLGYWLRNPIAGPRHLWNAPGPLYLLREMTGWMHEKTGYLNLSDGGHIENLALYQMLRRRCKFIVVVDGGQEPGMEFADLMLAQRYAQIDMGVQLELDLADLVLNTDRRGRAYALFGKVHYSQREDGSGGNDLGWLVYFKLARTGSEPDYDADSARQDQDFPHQTTGDQMHNEAQFEAYRRLGECAAESLFRPEISNPYSGDRPAVKPDHKPTFETLETWFQSLANSLLVDNDPAFDSATPAQPGPLNPASTNPQAP